MTVHLPAFDESIVSCDGLLHDVVTIIEYSVLWKQYNVCKVKIAQTVQTAIRHL